MASDGSQLAASPIASSGHLPKRRSALVVLPFVLVGMVTLGRLLAAPADATSRTSAGVESATHAELTSAASATLEAALTRGPGITFEIVQTSMVVARPGGPLVDIPDPADRTRSLGQAETYAIGMLIERGQASPDGFWMELLQGPAPGAEAGYRLDTAQLRREALVRDGETYRNDGRGWHPTDQPPGIGLDPVTVAMLPALLTGTTDTKDVPTDAAASTSKDPPPDDTLARATTPLVAADVAAGIDGLEGVATPVVRTIEGTTTADAVPGIIAVDLAAHTELRGPVQMRFDEAGRLVGLTVIARNTLLDVHDLVVETYLTIRYPERAPELPRPEPVYVEPTPIPDEAGQ